jgi:hypothetical protein
MSARTLAPVSEALAARLRLAAAASSPNEAQTWLPAAPLATSMWRALVQALCSPAVRWCRQA